MQLADIITTALITYQLKQLSQELIWLLTDVVTTAPRRVLEIGVEGGGTSYVFREWFKPAVLVSVDLLPQPPGFDHVHIQGDSHAAETLERVAQYAPFDFVFIDGDHSYQGVKRDFEMYAALAAPGAIIALHDISDTQIHRTHGCEVARFWSEVKHGHFTRELITGGWGGIGVIAK